MRRVCVYVVDSFSPFWCLYNFSLNRMKNIPKPLFSAAFAVYCFELDFRTFLLNLLFGYSNWSQFLFVYIIKDLICLFSLEVFNFQKKTSIKRKKYRSLAN